MSENQNPATDPALVKGTVTIVLRDEDGNVKQEETISNLVTQVGNAYFADRAAAGISGSPLSTLPAQVTGMRLGTGTTAAATTGAGAAIVTYISASQSAMDTGFPTGGVGAGTSRRITWRATWAAGTATNAAITEAVITNESPLTNVAGTAANTTARVVLTAINKTATDSLELSWVQEIGA